MIRTITFVIALAASIAPVSLAWADDPPPTKEQLDAAKKAFQEGDALYRAGKLVEALDKIKESYRLSRNPMLLYNLGHIADQAGQRDDALSYYRKFLASAPANAPKRAEATARLEALEKESAAAPPVEEAAPATPTGKYSAADFKHEVVFTAPPGKPLDIVAVVPDDAGWTLTLFYRGNNDVTFAKEPMTPRNKELVATIPGAKLAGTWIQYYIEVRDGAGALVTRSGKSTSPNLISFEGGATAGNAEEDPLTMPQHVAETPTVESPATRVPVTTIVKWSSTALAASSLVMAITTAILAKHEHDKLRDDAMACGPPPCRQFDAEFDQKVEELGVRYDLMFKISLGVGIATAGVAGYFWYRDLTTREHTDVAGSPRKAKWAIAPALAGGYAGATAAVRF